MKKNLKRGLQGKSGLGENEGRESGVYYSYRAKRLWEKRKKNLPPPRKEISARPGTSVELLPSKGEKNVDEQRERKGKRKDPTPREESPTIPTGGDVFRSKS